MLFVLSLARSLDSRHAIAHPIRTPKGLEGYACDAAASQPDRLLLRRAAP